MNFYDAKLTKNGDKYTVQVEDAVIELSADKCARLAAKGVESQEITAGVRPEHISLDNVPGKMVKATVDVSEMMGSQIHLHVNAMGKDGIIIVDTLGLNGRSFKIGEEIEFTFGGNVIHVFDKDGRNLEY